MPVWVPPTGEDAGFTRRSNAKAVAKGLTFRPLAVTAKDTLDWNKTRPAAEQKKLDDGTPTGLAGGARGPRCSRRGQLVHPSPSASH